MTTFEEQVNNHSSDMKMIYTQACEKFVENEIKSKESQKQKFLKILEDEIVDSCQFDLDYKRDLFAVNTEPTMDALKCFYRVIASYLDEENRLLNRNIEDIKNIDDIPIPIDPPDEFIDELKSSLDDTDNID